MHPAIPTAAIVAGGHARRFGGRDKSRLVVEGRPIIFRQLETLQQVSRDPFVVANDPARFADLNVRVVPDRIPGAGALGGVYTALLEAAADLVLVVACDLPFLDGSLLNRLVELTDGHDGARVQTPAGIEPLLACYRRDAAPRLLREIQAGRLRASALDRVLDLATLGLPELERFGAPDRLLANVNTPDDHARIQ